MPRQVASPLRLRGMAAREDQTEKEGDVGFHSLCPDVTDLRRRVRPDFANAAGRFGGWREGLLGFRRVIFANA